MSVKRLPLAFGDLVEVRAVIERRREGPDGRSIKHERVSCEPFEAWVVGRRAVFDGHISGDPPRRLGLFKGVFGEPSDYDPRWMRKQSSMNVVLVRRGMANREVMVREDDLKVVRPVLVANYIGPSEDLMNYRQRTKMFFCVRDRPPPYQYANRYKWTDRDRSEERQRIYRRKRDARGRLLTTT
jgi:hypothetical protein